jgi:hypothetical protein
VVEARDLPGKKAREKKKKEKSGLVRKSSSFIFEVSSPNLMVVEKGIVCCSVRLFFVSLIFFFFSIFISVTADPYCVIRIGEEYARTRTITHKTNPFWCEEWTLYDSNFFLFSLHLPFYLLKLENEQQ